MATEWYYKDGTAERGPMQFRELADLARTGTIKKADFVRSTWHKDWQPAESVLKQYFSETGDTDPHSPWAETVDAAMQAARRRAGHRQPSVEERQPRVELPSFRGVWVVFGWLIWPFAWLIEKFSWLEAVVIWLDGLWSAAIASPAVKIALQTACGFATLWLAAVLLREWSAQAALLHLVESGSKANRWSMDVAGLHFPLIGACSSGAYWVMYGLASLGGGVGGYFGAQWFLTSNK